MIWYDIYLLQLDFHPVAAVRKVVKKMERDSYMQKEKHYTNNTKAQKTQNGKQKNKKNIKEN